MSWSSLFTSTGNVRQRRDWRGRSWRLLWIRRWRRISLRGILGCGSIGIGRRGDMAAGRHPLAFEQVLTMADHATYLQTVKYLARTGRPAVVIAAGGL